MIVKIRVKIDKDKIIRRSKDSKVYRCSQPTFEEIKEVSLGKLLGSVELKREYLSINEERSLAPNHDSELDEPIFADFLFKKAVKKHGKNILVLDYVEPYNVDGPLAAEAKVFSNKMQPLEKSLLNPRFVALNELTIPKYSLPIFHESLPRLEELTGKRFKSAVKGEVIYITTNDWDIKGETISARREAVQKSTEEEAVKLLYEVAKKAFGKNTMVCDLRIIGTPIYSYVLDRRYCGPENIRRCPLKYSATGIVIKRIN